VKRSHTRRNRSEDQDEAAFVGASVVLGDRCMAITANGRRCSRDATMLLGRAHWYCEQHANSAGLPGIATRAKAPGPSHVDRRHRRKKGKRMRKGFANTLYRSGPSKAAAPRRRASGGQRPSDSVQGVRQSDAHDRHWRGH
jgi:hypothetical protein